MRYGKQLIGGAPSTYDSVMAIKFSENYNKIVLVLNKPINQALTIIVMDINLGLVLLQLQETS